MVELLLLQLGGEVVDELDDLLETGLLALDLGEHVLATGGSVAHDGIDAGCELGERGRVYFLARFLMTVMTSDFLRSERVLIWRKE